MDSLIEIGFVFLFLIVVIWLIVRDEPKRHAAQKGRHRVRRNNGYTDSSPAYPVITNDDSHTHHSRHTHDHKHHDGDSFSGSNHHHSSDTGSSSDSGGDSGGGDGGGGGD
ncbi:hypothetical protein JNUCC31_17770 [Paenibacillus sp. JNUCC31]|uniref:hypothetical protein n=1 Tax=Paenibacillus sp. JNUCC-31 TaxID=2777983 RepID=UPI00177F0FB4|nr:hypothetical protein [Paenibacillus sp. JNUCC-31]QOS76695.1 hypothetical protein JNUCC31_17770 [Paenibacillus sp. JNUCC-31]